MRLKTANYLEIVFISFIVFLSGCTNQEVAKEPLSVVFNGENHTCSQEWFDKTIALPYDQYETFYLGLDRQKEDLFWENSPTGTKEKLGEKYTWYCSGDNCKRCEEGCENEERGTNQLVGDFEDDYSLNGKGSTILNETESSKKSSGVVKWHEKYYTCTQEFFDFTYRYSLYDAFNKGYLCNTERCNGLVAEWTEGKIENYIRGGYSKEACLSDIYVSLTPDRAKRVKTICKKIYGDEYSSKYQELVASGSVTDETSAFIYVNYQQDIANDLVETKKTTALISKITTTNPTTKISPERVQSLLQKSEHIRNLNSDVKILLKFYNDKKQDTGNNFFVGQGGATSKYTNQAYDIALGTNIKNLERLEQSADVCADVKMLKNSGEFLILDIKADKVTLLKKYFSLTKCVPIS
ncbi:hypothetical protein JXB27_03220 [Candidatus Woesearchaeota archaeon]|nr:hypothetical protein [Candidatus Woesearchaeota archaeon]